MDASNSGNAPTPSKESSSSWSFLTPLNVGLLVVCGYLLYKIIGLRQPASSRTAQPKRLPKMKRRDFTVQELRKYDGQTKDSDDPERILVAVNGTVFDMSNAGRRHYGPGGAYSIFAGRDASRALATFSLSADQFRDEFDDLADLNASQMESVREWERQYREKYDIVGRLLKPGEQPNVYSDEDEDGEKSAAGLKGKEKTK